MRTTHLSRRLALASLFFVSLFLMINSISQANSALAQSASSVTLVGDLQSELGCSGDWQPDCTATPLTEIGYGLWRGEYTVPAGAWEYKTALNGTWDVSYPAGNIPLSVAANTDVRFYFDEKTTAVLDNINDKIAVAAGTFQDELGCPGDWQAECVNTLLTDVDSNGIYSFVSADIPVGDYNFKVTLDEAWTTSYPASDLPFSVTAAKDVVTITWNSATNDVTVDVVPDPGNDSTATLAGNFQDELGCPGDWQPECTVTQLTKIGNGVWRGLFTIPAGTWEYKAALNGTWDVSYPAGNIPLTLAADTDVRFYFDEKTTAVHDDVNNIVAIAAGNFQTFVGCSGDWQANCVNSLLTDADGDNIYTFTTTDIPAGSYEFKITLNEAWDTSYPGGNVPFTTTDGAIVTMSYNATNNDVNIAVSGNGLEPGDELLVRSSLRTPLADELFYFVLPDRFENGDPSNDDAGTGSSDPLVHGNLPTDKGFYHGGDLAGLTSKLDYLNDLGVTAVWLTPQFTNNWVQGDGTIAGSSAAYHGYWQTDYTQIDPHFGSNVELQAFIDNAHARGIKVFFDIVLNHTGDVIDYDEGLSNYRDKTDFPYQDADGNEFDDRDYAGTANFPPLDAATSFPYTPIFPTAAGATAKAPAWLNNPIYYHNRGNSTFSGESSTYGDFFGLDDLFTEHPDVVNGMIDIHKQMISQFGIDGFRIDTVKHVNDEMWEAFIPAIQQHAADEGIADFFIFGEVFSGDPAYASRFTTELPFPSLLDFGFEGTVKSFAASSNSTDQVRDFFASDDYYTDDDSNAYGLVKFIGNHDIGRFGNAIDSANPGADDNERVARAELGYALAYFSRGIPLVYYGDEQGFTGDGGDKDARQDMMPSLVPSYNDDNLIGTSATTADDNFDETHPLFQTFSDMAQLRDAHVALRQGVQIHRYSEGSAGIYAFSRIDPAEQVEYLVVLNNSESADSATFTTGTPDATFNNLIAGGAVVADANGDVTVNLDGLSFAVFQADSGLPVGSTAPAIVMSTPAANSEVTGRIEVAATVGT